MSSGPSVVLVGPPGSGKSTVGRVVARRMGVRFADVDTLIEERAGKSIADMFNEDGEDVFRALEREVVADALRTETGVLALGGGSVLAAETRSALLGNRVVYLTLALTDGLRRTGMSSVRPLLAGVNPRATFRALLEARAPLYEEVATLVVSTSGRGANQVAAAVLEALGEDVEVPAPVPGDPLDRPTPRGGVPLPDLSPPEPRRDAPRP